ncbi:MAG TPA: SDR family NAD(P)-dependent oxidoreductase, partial [Neisseria sp.]|nr:SDR family NAD(P)-dependent oxidoreductase [Neisseria sp.]
MTQKVWLITGASRGFGHIWAKAALARGDKVAATARKLSALDELKQTYGDAFLPLVLDVTDRDAVFAAVAQVQQHFGRLDVVVSNAGFGYMAAIEEAEIDDTRATFETNVFGTLAVMQAAAGVSEDAAWAALHEALAGGRPALALSDDQAARDCVVALSQCGFV